MQIGCTLPRGVLDRLKAIYKHVGLLEEGEQQMARACEEYIDGKPFEFVSLGLLETADMRSEGIEERPEPKALGSEIVPSGSPAAWTSEPPIVEYELWFPPGTCADCGSSRGYGNLALKRCKGCKDTL